MRDYNDTSGETSSPCATSAVVFYGFITLLHWQLQLFSPSYTVLLQRERERESSRLVQISNLLIEKHAHCSKLKPVSAQQMYSKTLLGLRLRFASMEQLCYKGQT